MAIIFGSPIAVGLVASACGYLVWDSSQEKRRKIRDSYRDPGTLVKGTTGDDKLTLMQFFKTNPPEAPCVVAGSTTSTQTQAGATVPLHQPAESAPNVEGESVPPGLMPQLLQAIEIPFDRRNIILPAGQREGKSNLIRVLMSEQKQLDPNMRVHYVTSKIKDEVPDWWKGYLISGDRQQQVERLAELIDEWQELFNVHAEGKIDSLDWLVFDEEIYLYGLTKNDRELRNNMEHLLASLATQGSSVGMGSVLMGQSENAGAFGIPEDLMRKNYLVFAPAKHKHSEAIRSVEKLVRGREKYPEELRGAAKQIAQSQQYSVFAAYDSDELCVYFPPEFSGPLKQLQPVVVGGNDLLKAVRGKISPRAQSAGDIRKAFPSAERPDLADIQGCLGVLVSDGEIQEIGGGKAPKYKTIFIPPTVPPEPPAPAPAVAPRHLEVVSPHHEPDEPAQPAQPDLAQVGHTTHDRLALAKALADELPVDQLGPENAIEFYHRTGNERIPFVFQSRYVAAGLMTDAEYDARCRVALQRGAA